MRPATLFLFVDAFVARADLRWRGRCAEVVALRRHDRGSGGVADRLDTLLAEEPCRGAAVVFSDDVFLRNLELPQRAVAGLSARDLAQAVALEAQAQSGFAGDVTTTHRRPRDERTFLVAQTPSAELAACVDSLERSGGRLAALLHPAALPGPLADVGAARWVRHEEWGGLRAIVRGRGPQVERLRVGGAGQLADPDEPTEQLTLRTAGAISAAGAATFELALDQGLQSWFRRWAEALAAGADALLLTPPEPAAVRHRRWLAAGLLLLAAGVAAFLDHHHLQQEVVAARSELVRVRAPLDRLQALESDIAAVQRQIANAGDPTAPPMVRSPWSEQSIAMLLEQLARQRPAGVLLEDVQLGWRRTQVRGVAPTAAVADRFAEALAQSVHARGFVVLPTSRERLLVAGTDVCAFTLELNAIVPAPPTTTPPVVEVGR